MNPPITITTVHRVAPELDDAIDMTVIAHLSTTVPDDWAYDFDGRVTHTTRTFPPEPPPWPLTCAWITDDRASIEIHIPRRSEHLVDTAIDGAMTVIRDLVEQMN